MSTIYYYSKICPRSTRATYKKIESPSDNRCRLDCNHLVWNYGRHTYDCTYSEVL